MKFFAQPFMAIVTAAAIFCASLTPSLAQDLNLEGLSEKAQIELQEQLLKAKKEALTPSASDVTDPEKLNEWVNLGKNVGQGLAGAAKELGTGATEFAQTSVGKLVAFIVVWKVLGKDLVLIFTGFFFLLIGNAVFGRIYWKKNFETTISYHENGKKAEIVKGKTDQAWNSKNEAEMFWITFAVSNIIGVACLIFM